MKKAINDFDAKALLVDFLEDEMTESEHRIVQVDIMSSSEARSELRSLSETRELLRIGMDDVRKNEHEVDMTKLHDKIMFQIDNLDRIDELLDKKNRTNGHNVSLQDMVEQTLLSIQSQLKVL